METINIIKIGSRVRPHASSNPAAKIGTVKEIGYSHLMGRPQEMFKVLWDGGFASWEPDYLVTLLEVPASVNYIGSHDPMPAINTPRDICVVRSEDATGLHFWRYEVERGAWNYSGAYKTRDEAKIGDPAKSAVFSSKRKSIRIFHDTPFGRCYLCRDGTMSTDPSEAAVHWGSQFRAIIAENWIVGCNGYKPRAEIV
jgi:hypothetical protein